MILNGLRYAVEVTGMMPLVSVDGRSLQEVTVIASLWRLVEEIEEAAITEGILEGQYTVFFIRPVQNLASVRRQLKSRIVNYLERTKAEESYPEEMIIPHTCFIRKVASTRPALYPVGPGGGGGEDQIRSEAKLLLASAIDTKSDKLRAKGIASPAILLVENYHVLAEPWYYLDCAADIGSADRFHTIFLVHGDRDMVLRTRESAWMAA
jgi:hypothetical protein